MLMASSPQVRSGTESYAFSNYIGPLLREWRKEMANKPDSTGGFRPVVGLSAYLTESEFMSAIEGFTSEIMGRMVPNLSPGEIFVEKTPNHALYAQEIALVLPKCKIIHIMRDPRDVVASMLRIRQALGVKVSNPDPRSAAQVWRSHVSHARMVSHLSNEGRFLEIKYEELYSSTRSTLEKVFEFVGLRLPASEIDHYIEMSSVEKIRNGTSPDIPLSGVAGKEVGSAVKLPREFAGKATVGNWKTDLTTTEKFWVWYEVGELMESCGYHWDAPWWYPVGMGVIRSFRPAARRPQP